MTSTSDNVKQIGANGRSTRFDRILFLLVKIYDAVLAIEAKASKAPVSGHLSRRGPSIWREW